MDDRLVIRGVPHVLATDAIWLDGETHVGTDNATYEPGRTGAPLRAAPIFILVMLADLLFWRHAPGASVALFALGVLAVAAWGKPPAAWVRPAAVVIAGALPVINHLQILSVAYLMASLILALVCLHHPAARIGALVRAAAVAAVRLPEQWLWPVSPRGIAVMRRCVRESDRMAASWRAVLLGWAFPVGGSLVLLSLLLQANPVLTRLLTVDLDLWEALERGLFWVGAAIFIVPFLGPMPATSGHRAMRKAPSLTRIGLNAVSVLRAVVMFNLLIALQTVTDMSILLAGARLPDGMTLAEYSHRGAYPLLATAILAGLFALAARPFLTRQGWTRPLMLVLVAQNIVVSGAAALRLELYIEAFGLTYTRLYALIWMGLVAAGLGLTLWQVLRVRTTAWLLTRVTLLGLSTLYLCSFMNMAQVVAARNVTRAKPDLTYLCQLGPLAAGPVVASGIGRVKGRHIFFDGCALPVPQVRGWREWGFRSWAVGRYVQATGQEK